MTVWRFTAEERPAFLGAPYTPPIGAGRRAAFALCGGVFAIASIFVAAIVTQNLQQVAASFAITTAKASWLSAVFLGLGAATNLLAIKLRQQYRVGLVFAVLLWIEVMAGVLALARPGFATAAIAIASHGMAMATGIATAVFYLLEVWPRTRLVAVATAIGTVQLALPLSRLVPVGWLTAGGNRGLTLIGIALPAIQIVLLGLWPLPPTLRRRVLRPLDLLSTALLGPALVMLAGALALGPLLGWTRTPWLGAMLAIAVAMAATAMMIEAGRRDAPLLYMGWALRPYVLWPFLIAVVDRSLVAAHAVGLVSLLGPAGLDNDRLHPLVIANAIGMATGILIVVRHLTDAAVPWLAAAALAATAVAALVAGLLPDPAILLASQALVGLGTTMFSAPALVYAIRRLREHGSEYFETQITMFAFSQTFGLLLGTAWSLSLLHSGERHGSVGAVRAMLRHFPAAVGSIVPGQATQILYAAIGTAAAMLAVVIATFLLPRPIRTAP